MLVNNIEHPEVLKLSNKKPWEVNHLDTMEMWKFGDRKAFTSLDLLTQLFGVESSNVFNLLTSISLSHLISNAIAISFNFKSLSFIQKTIRITLIVPLQLHHF